MKLFKYSYDVESGDHRIKVPFVWARFLHSIFVIAPSIAIVNTLLSFGLSMDPVRVVNINVDDRFRLFYFSFFAVFMIVELSVLMFWLQKKNSIAYIKYYQFSRLVVFACASLTLAKFMVNMYNSGMKLSSIADMSSNMSPNKEAKYILADVFILWVSNILIFSVFYWLINDGGLKKYSEKEVVTNKYQQYIPMHCADFIFPKQDLLGNYLNDFTSHHVDTQIFIKEGKKNSIIKYGPADIRNSCPSFLDYLFLAFNTSTSFSATDTIVLSARAKLLMMTQSLISLLILTGLLARVVNTFE